MSERLILVARVAGAFGVRGEVRITTFTADPLAISSYRELKRRDGSPGLTVTAARAAKGGVIARAREIDSKEAADALRGLELYVGRDRLPPTEDEDEFYLADLIGLRALSPEGAHLGRVKGVENYGADDLLEIDPDDGSPTWLIAFTRETAPDVDIAAGRVTLVRPREVTADPA